MTRRDFRFYVSLVAICMLLLLMTGLGTVIELEHLFIVLTEPTYPLIGFLSQYVVMPFVSWGVALLFLSLAENGHILNHKDAKLTDGSDNSPSRKLKAE